MRKKKLCFDCKNCENPRLVREKQSRSVMCKKRFINPMTGDFLFTTCWNARKHACFCGGRGIFWKKKECIGE